MYIVSNNGRENNAHEIASKDPAQKNAVLNKLIGTVIGVRISENNEIGKSKKKVIT